MSRRPVHVCTCSTCQKLAPNATKEVHAFMNFLLSQLHDEQQRFYVGLEARKRGPGSEHGLALILGWTEESIAVAKRELELAVLGPETGEAKSQSPEEAFKAKLQKANPLNLHSKTRFPNGNQWK